MPISPIIEGIFAEHTKQMEKLKEDFSTVLEDKPPPAETLLDVKEATRAETDEHLARLARRKETAVAAIDAEIKSVTEKRQMLEDEIGELKRRIKKQKEEQAAKEKLRTASKQGKTAET